MDHDPLIKQVLQEFLPEFMRLFFPDIATRLDLSAVEFMDKEVFTDLPQGRQRSADLVARLRTNDGQPELLLLHIEAQRKRGGDFPFRMFEYWVLLRLRRQLPVLPIAVYLSSGAGGIVEETYEETLFAQRQLSFRYHAVGLPDLSAADYVSQSNPLGPALSAIMKDSTEKIERKIRILGQRPILDADPARRALLLNFVDSYLPLNPVETAEFEQRITEPGQTEVQQMMTQYERKGIEIGRAEGIRLTLRDQLEFKFGPLSQVVTTRLEAMDDLEELRQLSRRILTANSLEELGLASQNSA